MELFTRINWLKIMRISCTQLLFLFLFCGMSYARTGKAQINLHQRVTITERYVKISNLLNRLEKAANIKFVYSLNVVDVTHKAYVAAGNRPLDSILNEVLLNNGIRYDVIYDRIVLYPLPKNKDNREPADNAAAAAGVSLKAVDVRGKVTECGVGLQHLVLGRSHVGDLEEVVHDADILEAGGVGCPGDGREGGTQLFGPARPGEVRDL